MSTINYKEFAQGMIARAKAENSEDYWEMHEGKDFNACYDEHKAPGDFSWAVTAYSKFSGAIGDKADDFDYCSPEIIIDGTI